LFRRQFYFYFLGKIIKDVKNYNFACCLVWVLNMVAYIEGGT